MMEGEMDDLAVLWEWVPYFLAHTYLVLIPP